MKKLLLLLALSSTALAVDKQIIAPTGSVVVKGNSTVKMQTYNTGAWQDRLTIANDGTITGNGSGLTSLNGTNISSGTVSASYLPVAGPSASGIVNQSPQIFAGAKTFSSGIVIGGNTTGDSNYGTITSVTNSWYYEGAFTVNLTGARTMNNFQFYYVKVGKVVVLRWVGQAVGSCSASCFSAASGSVPSNLRPSNYGAVGSYTVYNNGAYQSTPGKIEVYSDGSLSFCSNYADAGFAGNCNIQMGTLAYMVY